MSKELVLMKEVICKYHPNFVISRDLRNFGVKYPDHFKVEKLVEECLAALGPYTYINAAHADFSDGTDSKTASIRLNPVKLGQFTCRGEIAGVTSVAGQLKSGGLRCTIYNPHSNGLKFYFLPKDMWENHITYHPTSGIGKIMYSYNIQTDFIPKFNGYECRDFVDLALAS